MIIGILIALVVVAAGLVAFIASRPSDFRVARSAAIPVPASILFDQVNDLHKWGAWSPWDRLDSTIKKSFDGPPAGVGASYAWVGEKLGEGRMTLVENRPNEWIRFQLNFVKPFRANNTAEFTFEPQGDQTVVTWSMTGKNNFFSKLFNLFMNCDKMAGDQFQKGLANLGSVAEGVAGTANR